MTGASSNFDLKLLLYLLSGVARIASLGGGQKGCYQRKEGKKGVAKIRELKRVWIMDGYYGVS